MPSAPRVDRLFRAMAANGGQPAIAEGDISHSYHDLLHQIDAWSARLDHHGIAGGEVIGLQSDFAFTSITLALALFRRGCIVAFLSPSAASEDALAGCCAAGLFTFGRTGEEAFQRRSCEGSHPLLDGLRDERKPGFVIFSSGSSGRPKAILHDLDGFFAAYDRPTKPMTTLAFLLFDHIAGLDTLFYTLHAGGSLVLVADRSPRSVCDAVARWSVEVLPVSPSFLKLLCLGEAAATANLGSLRIVTFGSEPMDRATLDRVAERIPHARLRQKYGASEFGAPSARTREEDGLWIRFNGDDTVRVKDGVLWMRLPTTMLGYLNADQPRTADGWLCTGDRVEVDGEWLRILGRESDLINVGGEKVFPSEVEAVISELDAVAEVVVSGASHPLIGQIVSATIRPRETAADCAALRSLVRRHCMSRLARHKVPVKISFTQAALFNERQKLLRTPPPPPEA
ncbi:AMP-dependent synthetase [Novosphingobium endophyticum]|uniref:AMP-dependent synthetase n=1 Tax=Novosphingobium endophyticum TaxID=1955250 RepID=A0A916TTK9_9SPHN|nr:fatty acid--CoA ligase family protein [Novosphingobium endophyticum]GGB95786.1 AMP-dependent synthetase [Novosphingobium endophyticum]